MTERNCRSGFTLVELLVSVTLLTLVLLMMVSMVNSTASTWRYTSGKIEQFRSASNAFEAITRRISQTTLNTYWDYDSQTTPTKYLRQSDLRFTTGETEALVGSTRRPTHGIFFQAPLGFVDDTSNFGGLDTLLNTWGYYIEFKKDTRPAFIETLPNKPPARYRYRLMELMQPANHLSIYNYTSGYDSSTPPKAKNLSYAGRDWFTTDPISGKNWFDSTSGISPPVHVLAENIIAMVLLPKLSKTEDSTGIKLCPKYSYDSSKTDDNNNATVNPAINWKNQLPPVVQVSLVAIDEASANRIANGANAPSFDALLDTLFVDAKNFDADLSSLQTELAKQHLSFRVFTSNISLRSAKWSRN